MKKLVLGMSALACAGLSLPLLAQDTSGAAGSMSAEAVGAAPMTGTPSASYVAWAADGDMYELQSSKLALSKSKNAHVRMMAQQLIADHTKTTKSLMAALPKTEPKVPKPPKKLSAENEAMVAQLRAALGNSFDTLYLQQQAQAHQKAWSLHKGYATDGTDPALKQVATSAVPIIEAHIQHLKSAPAS